MAASDTLLHDLAQNFFDWKVKRDPFWGHRHGLSRCLQRMPDPCVDNLMSEIVDLKSFLLRCQRLPSRNLSPIGRLQKKALQRRLKRDHFQRTTLQWWRSRPVGCLLFFEATRGALFDGQHSWETRFRALTKRLERLPRLLRQSKELITDPVDIWVQEAIEQISQIKTWLRDIHKGVKRLSPDLNTSYKKAMDNLIAAFDDYRSWLEDHLLPSSRSYTSMSASSYQEWLKLHGVDQHQSLYQQCLKSTQEAATLLKSWAKQQGYGTVQNAVQTLTEPADVGLKDLKELWESRLQTQHALVEAEVPHFPIPELRIQPAFLKNIAIEPYFEQASAQNRRGFTLVTPRRMPTQEGMSAEGLKLFTQLEYAPGVRYLKFKSASQEAPLTHLYEASDLSQGWQRFLLHSLYKDQRLSARLRFLALWQYTQQSIAALCDVECHGHQQAPEKILKQLFDKNIFEETLSRQLLTEVMRHPGEALLPVYGAATISDLEAERHQPGSDSNFWQAFSASEWLPLTEKRKAMQAHKVKNKKTSSSVLTSSPLSDLRHNESASS